MDKLTKKILMYAVLILLMMMPLFIHNVSHADSGWDTGYSSSSRSSSSHSSSSRSSSSRSSSSRSSSSRSSSSHSSGSSTSGKTWSEMNIIEKIFYVIFVGFLGLLWGIAILGAIIAFGTAIFEGLRGLYRKIHHFIVGYYKDMDKDKFSNILPNYSMNELKKEFYNKFVEIQNAWMNFDYDKLRILCTDELFNTYKSQLRTLKLKNGQNIMSNFKQKEIKIRFARTSKSYITVGIFLRVSFIDYVINKKTNKVTAGKKHRKITNNYLMEFVKANGENIITKCPSCGAKVNMVTSGECEHCGATIVVPPKEFVLSKKTNQKTE